MRIVGVRSAHSRASLTRKEAPVASTPTPNDQRSDVKNPNNPAQKQAQDNRANQLNPNHQPTKGQPAKK